MSWTLMVLTPTGRRQTVKVTPNTTLLQVLEEVCTKHGLQAEQYNLKHHRKILDVSLTIRFAGLPNNCLLEMIEAEVARTEQAVTVGVQTEDGKRVIAEFNCASTIEHILQKLCPVELREDTVVIYMRNEIYGEQLRQKTLRALGIISGNVILRLLHRRPEELKVQANVSAPLPSKPAEEKPYKRQFQPIEKEPHKPVSTSAANDYAWRESRHIIQGKSTKPNTNIFDQVRQEKRKQTDGLKIKSQPCKTANLEEREDNIKDDLIFLGARNAMLFSLETAQAVGSDDLPDDFFELSITDVKKLFRDIKKQRLELEDGPLMTKAMRNLEADKRQLLTLHQYKKSVIRVVFPDRLVLQGVFKPSETVQDVADFVRGYMADERLAFYLFTTPPKKVLSNRVNLLEAECVPGALLHFGADEKRSSYLRNDILTKVVPTTSATTAAKQTRLENVRQPRRTDDADDLDEFLRSEKVSTAAVSSDTVDYEPRASQPAPKLPKWFKPSK